MFSLELSHGFHHTATYTGDGIVTIYQLREKSPTHTHIVHNLMVTLSIDWNRWNLEFSLEFIELGNRGLFVWLLGSRIMCKHQMQLCIPFYLKDAFCNSKWTLLENWRMDLDFLEIEHSWEHFNSCLDNIIRHWTDSSKLYLYFSNDVYTFSFRINRDPFLWRNHPKMEENAWNNNC